MQPPADNPAAGSAAVNRIGQGVNPNILATPATPRACYPWPAASISARNPVATPRRIRRRRQSEHPGNPGNPAGVLSLARGVNQRKESGCNPPLITPPPDPPPSIG